MEDRGNKTIMSGVLFLDIVEYSKKSVAGQISLKDRFNSYLSAAIRDVPVSDRIILDTGDGAAINFLGDIEDALKAALSLRDSISGEDPEIDPPLQVRIGINLGPVRLMRDINGQPNIVGDGINVAQRVMGFADINQILVSRSYYDAVSRLSPEYAGMFHFQGSRTDKHVREHEIYAVGHAGDKTSEQMAANLLAEEEAKTPKHMLAPVKMAWNSAATRLDRVIERAAARFQQADSRQRALYVGLIVIPLVLAGALLLQRSPHDKAPVSPEDGSMQAASAVPPASPAAQAAAPVVAPAPRAESKVAVQPVAKPDSKKAGDGKAPPAQARVTEPKPAGKKASPAPAAGSPEPLKEAYVYIVCREGAQLFVDGVEKDKPQLFADGSKGKMITTGLTVGVTPGPHKIIVTSKSGSLYTQNIDLEPGKTVRIRPNFCD